MDSTRQPMETPTGRPKDSAARRAGLFLLLTAAATVVMVYARVSADADQPTLLESLRAIAASEAMYSLSGAARLISGSNADGRGGGTCGGPGSFARDLGFALCPHTCLQPRACSPLYPACAHSR